MYPKTKLIKKIIEIPDYEKTVQEFLKVNSRLEKLEANQLKKIAREFGIKESSYKKSDLVKSIMG